MPSEAWLAIIVAGQTGARVWQPTLERFGSADAIVAASRRDLRRAGLEDETISRLQSPDPETMAAWQAWLSHDDHDLVTFDSPRYPRSLKETGSAPTALWVRGKRARRDDGFLDSPQLAIVGSRHPTTGGIENAHAFARYLSEQGLTITSGLATGIDSASHKGALAGIGSTVAVLGTGIDMIYPRENERLATEIENSGIIVSEYPPGTPARRGQFPRRNRIIAGLCSGVLVVEAGRQSGSLITARFAVEYGREVFAIPGSIHNPMARGTHALIRQGAKLVEDAADVLVELAPFLGIGASHETNGDSCVIEESCSSAEYRELLEALPYDPASIDDLARNTGLTAAELSSMLLVLEMEGQVEALPGARYARKLKRI
jgi:DNA processing protein